MKKVVNFHLSSNTVAGKIRPGFDFDSNNGYTGEYLGIYNILGRNMMFTRTLHEIDHIAHERGEIRVNEVEFDVNGFGGITLCYNYDGTKETKMIMTELRSSVAHNMLDEGKTMSEVLEALGIPYKKSNISEYIEKFFEIKKMYVLRYEKDFKKQLAEFGEKYLDHHGDLEVPAETLEALGVSKIVLEELRDIRECTYQPYSFYELAYFYRKQKAKEERKEEEVTHSKKTH